jgi:16S rRNA (cytosine967-C5)-methyltransferase
LTIRVNTLRASRSALQQQLLQHEVATRPTRFAPDGLVVTSGNPLLTPFADSGLFIVQDESSQLVGLLTAAAPGEQILDACAAPGGKTTAMAAAMQNRGLIVATDVRGRRVDLLARAVATAGATCVRVVQADAAGVLPFRSGFDCVLLDAPCSGLGTLRRDPEIRWRRSEASLEGLAATQLGMLGRAAEVLRPGGRLIYSTCSSEPDENEEVVNRFLEGRKDFVLEPVIVPAALEIFRTAGGHFRTLPHRDELEPFFAAMVVKTKDLR